MNIISLGYQCCNAAALSALRLRKTALPFDWFKSPLPSTVKVLKMLKDPNFNMQTLLKEMFSVRSCNTLNIHGFNVAHFHLQQWKGWCSKDVCIDASFDPCITTEEHLKCELMYKYDDVYSLTAHPKVYEIFERRFNRLKDMFFTQENILIYNDIRIPESLANTWEPSMKELMSLNPLNRLVYITYADRQLLLPLVDKVEVYRLDSRCVQGGTSYARAMRSKIQSIFTGIS